MHIKTARRKTRGLLMARPSPDVDFSALIGDESTSRHTKAKSSSEWTVASQAAILSLLGTSARRTYPPNMLLDPREGYLRELTPETIDKMRVKELRECCKEAGLLVGGKKAELQARLLEYI
mmetsp:Transcript_30023/g.74577  ORF Transcript_30023/g.74577 Transcript_30023/m.74577 type:complete len:121 (-) Transcript_30023:42-404(-)